MSPTNKYIHLSKYTFGAWNPLPSYGITFLLECSAFSVLYNIYILRKSTVHLDGIGHAQCSTSSTVATVSLIMQSQNLQEDHRKGIELCL